MQFLRILRFNLRTYCVFTHSDLHPGNIIVDQDKEGWWKVISIVDWERSGFYPDYWETAKMTNCLAPMDGGDWYLHLLESISPQRYAVKWLIDRLLDR
jgi:Ser/Thr protein kinase RdoA (MazF antagonist)